MEINDNISIDSILDLIDIDQILNSQDLHTISTSDDYPFPNGNNMYLLVEIIKLKSENNQLEKKIKMTENLIKSSKTILNEKFNLDDFVNYINEKRNFLTNLGVNNDLSNINIISLDNKKKERKKKNKKN